MNVSIIVNPQRNSFLIDALTSVWEASVTETHHFLTKADISSLKPYAAQGLKEIPLLAIAMADNKPIGFIGIAEKKVEMLFVAPKYIGQHIGSQLMLWAKHEGIKYIDVNEQNPKAVDIYRHWGFQVYERTENDEQGNPFPILKMRLSD